MGELRSATSGLTNAEAASRLLRYGPNQVEEQRRSHLLVQFLRRFTNPLTLILLFAAGISAATGEGWSFSLIVAIVVLSVSLDFVQEQRAGRAAEALRARVALNTQVLRDGRPETIGASAIVPGDVVMLSAGDLVPADCRLIALRDLFVNEALLTGESLPAEKVLDSDSTDTVVPRNAVFAGSSVVSGTATVLVVRTGGATQFGAIARSLRSEPQTAFELGIRDFGLLIVRLTVLLVLFVILVNLLFHRPVLESFLFALALAVGLTPELLPMVISVTLAHGAIRLSRKQVIVKRLSAIHDLGSMDVLCSDKTGTLTEAKISLVREMALDGSESSNVLRLAHLNAAFETGLKSPLDLAILEGCHTDLTSCRKIDEVPFDFERRRVSVLVEDSKSRVLIVKGAPEDVLAHSNRYESSATGGVETIDTAIRAEADALLAKLGQDGFRALGVAWRDIQPEQERVSAGDERDLIFAGFALFLDPPKETAKAALAALQDLGVALKILTGDNEYTARHVCDALSVNVSGLVTGPAIAAMSDEALGAQVETANLFCRITPMQKARIIRALRRRGHVVGYIGDGINDAPSINAADAGISVDTAVDVARQAASIILLQKDLGVLAEGVKEGRRTFANILKYIVMGTSSNFGNMFSMAAAVLILPFLPMLPLQILLNNFLYDLSEVAIPMDRVDADLVAKPHRWNMKFVRNVMLVLGPVNSAFDFITFGVLLLLFHADQTLFHTGWFIESLATQVLVIFIIRTRGSPFKSRAHPALVASAVAVIAVALLLPYLTIGLGLGFVPPPLTLLLALAATTTCYLATVQIAKIVLRRRLAEL